MSDSYEARRQQKRKWQRRIDSLRTMQRELINKQEEYSLLDWSDDAFKDKTLRRLDVMITQLGLTCQHYGWLIDNIRS